MSVQFPSHVSVCRLSSFDGCNDVMLTLPIHRIPLWSIPIALGTGNTVLLKPSERDPGASAILVELAARAGFPKGTLNVVHGSVDTVNFICDEPRIKAISFVGGNAAGEHIFTRGSKNGKRVQANLGAKVRGARQAAGFAPTYQLTNRAADPFLLRTTPSCATTLQRKAPLTRLPVLPLVPPVKGAWRFRSSSASDPPKSGCQSSSRAPRLSRFRMVSRPMPISDLSFLPLPRPRLRTLSALVKRKAARFCWTDVDSRCRITLKATLLDRPCSRPRRA